MKTDVRPAAEIAADRIARDAARARRRIDTVSIDEAWKAAREAANRLAPNRRGFTRDDRFDFASDAILDAWHAHRVADPLNTGEARLASAALADIRLFVNAARMRVARDRANREPDYEPGETDISAVAPNTEIWHGALKRTRRYLNPARVRDALEAWAQYPSNPALQGQAREAIADGRVTDADTAHDVALAMALEIAPRRRPLHYGAYLACYSALRGEQGFSTEEIAREVGMEPAALRKATSRGYAAVRKLNTLDDLRAAIARPVQGGRKPTAGPASTPWKQSGPLLTTLTLESTLQAEAAAMAAAVGADWTSVLAPWLRLASLAPAAPGEPGEQAPGEAGTPPGPATGPEAQEEAGEAPQAGPEGP